MPPDPLRILLVEDNPNNRRVAHAILSRRGHRVDSAENGRLALEKLADAAYDLVLMDVMMPEMDGFEATRRIRAAEGGVDPALPIVALTAMASDADRRRCLDAGMDAFVAKPIDRDAFVATVESLGAGRSTAAEAAGADEPRHFDPAVLAGLRELEEGGFFSVEEYVETFVTDGRRRLEAMAGALETADAATFEREAHTLKGGAREMGAGRLAAIAEALESAGGAREIGGAGAGVAAAREEFEKLCRTLAAGAPPARPKLSPDSPPGGAGA